MQLQSIRISNVLSFPYLEPTNKSETLSFGTGNDSAVNILIGPNGSGKSNFINVLEQLYTRGIIKDYIYNKKNAQTGDRKNTIIYEKSYFNRLESHRDYISKPSEIEISFLLTDGDYDNIGFICKNYKKLNALISQYSHLDIVIPEINFDDIRLAGNTINLKFNLDFYDNEFVLVDSEMNDIQKFIYMCISGHELFQICIDLYNDFGKEEINDRNRYPLKNSFAIVGYDRQLTGVSHLLNPEFADQFFFGIHRQFGNSLMGFYLCIKKIWNILHNFSEENYFAVENFVYSDRFIKNKLKKSDFFNSLNYVVKKYLNKELVVSMYENQIKFYLMDEFGNEFIFSDLSDGEQSLLHMIFDVYGYDMKGGFILFDEPEIHFHPQMQRSFEKMIEKMSENIKCQFAISTYSPLIINENNIYNVYRFQKDAMGTKVVCPGKYIGSDESNLVHILKFDNASKIFFVNKIIMVEGETDAYFFQHYLQYLHTLPEWKDKIKNYEIININGKGGYKKWNQFLSKFGLQTYFIGDWDNIVDYDILGQFDINRYYKQSKSYYAEMKRSHRMIDNHYGRLVNTLKNLHVNVYNHVVNRIKYLYKKSVFILQRGDIEAYLGMNSKGLDETIYFCQNNFEKWLDSSEYLDHRKEFEFIISKIFS